MPRFILTLLASVITLSLASAQQPTTAAKAPSESDTARKVRVALALAGGCGACRDDLDGARADALKQNKPLVLFVGGCDGRAKELDSAAIYCRVPEYRIEGKPVEGIVILGQMKSEKPGAMYILGQLAKTATLADIRQAVKLAADKAPPAKAVPLNWDFGRDADDEPAADFEDGITTDGESIFTIAASSYESPAILADCPNGRCAAQQPASVAAFVGSAPGGERYATTSITFASAPSVSRRRPVRAVAGAFGQTVVRIGVGMERWGVVLQQFGRLIPFAPSRRGGCR